MKIRKYVPVQRIILINTVIEDLKKGFEHGDYTVLEELLGFIPSKNLLLSLPEELWDNFPSIKKRIIYLP